ncbi:MAG: 2Fe-2S iron-sulfur cluster-binding protein [Pseudomonadota bacterium]
MPIVNVTIRDGSKHVVEAQAGEPLMYALRDNDLDVEATCGGACSCATCHIYIEAGWLETLPAPQADEQDVLSELIQTSENSRLCCQIVMDDALNGLAVTVAAPES